MTRLLFRIALALTAFGAVTSLRAQDLRVLTFNIRYDNPKDGFNRWENRREAVIALIKKEADVAGLQEVLPRQREEIAEGCPEFGLIGVGRDVGDEGEASPVMYRKDRLEAIESGTFWLSDTPDEVGSRGWGNVLPRICTWAKLRDLKTDAVFYFYNAHLDDQSQPSRERSVVAIANRIADSNDTKSTSIFIGDFNAVADNPAFAPLTELTPPLTSVYEILNVEPEGTFHGFTGQTKFAAIDFVFVDQARWKVKSREVLRTTYRSEEGTDRFVSDHFPVKAVMELAK